MRRIPLVRGPSRLLSPASAPRSPGHTLLQNHECPPLELSTARSALRGACAAHSFIGGKRGYSTLPPNERATQPVEASDGKALQPRTHSPKRLPAGKAAGSVALTKHGKPRGQRVRGVWTNIVLPPKRYPVSHPDDIEDISYVPAESGIGLEEVGGLQGYFEKGSQWNRSKEIESFLPRDKILDPSALETVLRQAVVEALAIRDRGSALEASPQLRGQWRNGGMEAWDAAVGIDVAVAEDGTASINGNVDAVISGLTGDEPPKLYKGPPPDQCAEIRSSWDQSWKRISLEDAPLKFAVTKRIIQLTGHIIPDWKLAGVWNVQDFFNCLVEPPKPKKVFEAIVAGDLFTNSPNVSVYGKRVTPVDKDKMTGRWKVITEELEKRGLPVLGKGGLPKTIEKKWVDGGLTAFKRLPEEVRKDMIKQAKRREQKKIR